MTYKGENDEFTLLDADQQGGVAEYCWVAMNWILNNCPNGGTFTNHQLNNAQGARYWDVRLDPNELQYTFGTG